MLKLAQSGNRNTNIKHKRLGKATRERERERRALGLERNIRGESSALSDSDHSEMATWGMKIWELRECGTDTNGSHSWSVDEAGVDARWHTWNRFEPRLSDVGLYGQACQGPRHGFWPFNSFFKCTTVCSWEVTRSESHHTYFFCFLRTSSILLLDKIEKIRWKENKKK